jgi:hypothetical protein
MPSLNTSNDLDPLTVVTTIEKSESNESNVITEEQFADENSDSDDFTNRMNGGYSINRHR